MTFWPQAGRADGRDTRRGRVLCWRAGCRHPRAVHQVGGGACQAHPRCHCLGFLVRNKYGARRAECSLGSGPHTHDSERERLRCWELHQRQATGEITGLTRQERYGLEVGGRLVGTYTADFRYWVPGHPHPVIEDVKSPATRKTEAYRLRRRLFEACWAPLVISEVE